MFEIVISGYTVHPIGTKRDRTIDNWSVHPFPDGNGYFLSGKVVVDNGETLPFLRLTNTSMIMSLEDDLVTTESGSTYRLLEPSESWSQQLKDSGETELIPKEYLAGR